MFIGHGLLAFALVGLVCRRYGVRPRRALAVGVVAGLFATAPDVDILYGPIGLLGGFSGVADAVDTFWATGNVVHRGPTHSLLVGGAAASGFGLLARRSRLARGMGLGVLVGLVVLTASVSGGLDAAIVTAFVLVGLAVVAVARRLDLSPRAIYLTALAGLLSHPFGDLLTGTPPNFLYPLDVVPFAERLSLHGDGTIHLLASFALELAIIWVAILVYFELTGRSFGANVDRRAVLGAGYGAAVFVLPAPTVDAASPFVLSVLSLGLVGAIPTRRSFRPALARVVATGLTTVTLAAAAFTAIYLVVSAA